MHETFSWSANYRRASGGATISDINVRLHLRNKQFGDLDREGFATVIESVDHVVLDTLEVPNPKRGDVAFVIDLNTSYRLETADPHDDGGEFQRWEVVKVPNP